MRSTAVFSRPGHFGRVDWEFDDRTIYVTPQGMSTETYPLRQISGFSGDDYTLQFGYEGHQFTLSRLGADGPTLRERLLRRWPLLRAEALCIDGGGEPEYFTTQYAAGEQEMRPCTVLLYDDVMILAMEDCDVTPVYLSSLSHVVRDESAYSVSFVRWDRTGGTFSRMGARTDEFVSKLDETRRCLAAEGASTLSTHLPTLTPSARAALTARWLPGEMIPLAALEAGAPGIRNALVASWMAIGPRAKEAEVLLAGASLEQTFVGYERRPDGEASPLWLLVGREWQWFLENLSEETYATYRFSAGPEMPSLAGMLLKSQRFSREALYLPLEELAGARGDLAMPAAELPFLMQLRERFQGRIIHDDFAVWRETITRIEQGDRSA
ncbi:MAG: hypothetical protein KKA32_05705 [Actinobacteria bacterium]|nr:hypothetical protein [Actinomycetota bacterium]